MKEGRSAGEVAQLFIHTWVLPQGVISNGVRKRQVSKGIEDYMNYFLLSFGKSPWLARIAEIALLSGLSTRHSCIALR